jgi:hypothetical protein
VYVVLCTPYYSPPQVLLVGEGVRGGVGGGALVDFSSNGSCLSGTTPFATSSAHNVHARAVRQMPVQRVSDLQSPSSLLHKAGAPCSGRPYNITNGIAGVKRRDTSRFPRGRLYPSLDVEGREIDVLRH